MEQKMTEFFEGVFLTHKDTFDLKLPIKIKVKSTLKYGGLYKNCVTSEGAEYHKIIISVHPEQNANVLQMKESFIPNGKAIHGVIRSE